MGKGFRFYPKTSGPIARPQGLLTAMGRMIMKGIGLIMLGKAIPCKVRAWKIGDIGKIEEEERGLLLTLLLGVRENDKLESWSF